MKWIIEETGGGGKHMHATKLDTLGRYVLYEYVYSIQQQLRDSNNCISIELHPYSLTDRILYTGNFCLNCIVADRSLVPIR